MNCRVMILGLDGLTHRVIQPYVSAGHLPNFQAILEGGASGTLKATVPAVTGPSWTSIATGRNPGKHGVFDFRRRRGYQTELGTRNMSLSAEPIWRAATRQGRRVIVADVPFTYPPDPVHGIMISGMMTPGTHADFIYPASFRKKLFTLAPQYQIDVDSSKHILSGNKQGLIDELFAMTSDRRKIINHFLREENWDLYFHVLVGTDRLQHVCWEDVMAMDAVCVDYYRLVDSILGDILGAMDERTALFLVSDHGFTASRKSFYINNFLRESGLLKLRTATSGKGLRLHRAVIRSPLLSAAVERIGLNRLKAFLPGPIRHALKQALPGASLAEDAVDWEQTKAFALYGYGMIFLNLCGREPSGIVPRQEAENVSRQIETALMQVRDPESQEPIVARVHRGSELYTPTEGIDTPDLVVTMRPGYSIREELGGDVLQAHKLGNLDISGDHDPDGILCAFGKPVGGDRCDASVYDIAPTALYLMGLPVPREMDGTVLQQMLNPERMEGRRIAYEDTDGVQQIQDGNLTDAERQRLTRYLQGLGYLK